MATFSIAQVVDALRAHHGLLVLTAEALGCHRSTLYHYAERYPAVAEAIATERERIVDLAERGLIHHLEEESPWAISLVLRTLGRTRGYEDKPVAPRAPETGEAQEWSAIQATLLHTLQAYPEARWAVVKALGVHADEPQNGHMPSA
jgi:hypothetical protein